MTGSCSRARRRTSTLVRRFAALFSLALWLSTAPVPAPVHAQPVASPQPPTAQAKARARELYTKGQQLFRQGHFADAQRTFEDAYMAVPNPIVLLSIAECQVRSEQFAAAVTTLRRYLDERKDAPDRAQVEAQIAKLEEKPAYLTVETTPAGALVFVDGQDTAKLTPAELELPAGDHRIAVQIEGFQRAEQQVTLVIGQRETLTLALPEVAPAAPEPVADREPYDGEPSRSRYLPVWVATGVAAAGLVTGSLLGGLALKERSKFNDDPTEASADKGEKLALFADVGFGVAVAGGVTALILYLTTGDDAEGSASAQAVSIAPSVSKRELGLSGSVRF
jgi:hypothetical protein